jgi:hypothetical protein
VAEGKVIFYGHRRRTIFYGHRRSEHEALILLDESLSRLEDRTADLIQSSISSAASGAGWRVQFEGHRSTSLIRSAYRVTFPRLTPQYSIRFRVEAARRSDSDEVSVRVTEYGGNLDSITLAGLERSFLRPVPIPRGTGFSVAELSRMGVETVASQLELFLRHVDEAIRWTGARWSVEDLASVTIKVESIVGNVLHALEVENSRLRGELDRLNIEADFLRQQVQNLTAIVREAQRSKRPALLKAGLLALGALIGSFATGIGEGVGSDVWAHFSGTDLPAIVELQQDCEALAEKVPGD